MARIEQISISDGGVPKTAVESAEVGLRGLVGDRQADTVHHGSPDQALCLYSTEVIATLRKEGHSIIAGSAGENFTISGLAWPEITPGTVLDVGDDLSLEITYYATPCSKNAQWFKDGKFGRILQTSHPGESRLYAKVLQSGTVNTGDQVRLVRTPTNR